jgi:hypothetical protein
MGSAIWAAKGNPNCRLPVTSRFLCRAALEGGYFRAVHLLAGSSTVTENQHHRDLVAPYLVTGRSCVGEFRSIYLRTGDPYA